MASKPSSAAFKKVAKLADNVNENRIELALALADLEEKTPGSVADFAKTRPKARRMLYYLLKVGRWLKPVGQPHSRYAKIGWTKLAILAEHSAKHPGKVAARAALARAEHCTAKQLPAVLDGNPLAPYVTEKTHHSVFLRLTPVEYGIFETILLKYGAMKLGKGNGKGKGLIGKEEALMNLLANALAA
jgi:hypothetical protein